MIPLVYKEYKTAYIQYTKVTSKQQVVTGKNCLVTIAH